MQTSEAVAAAHELATSFDGRVTATKGGKAEEQEGEEQEIKSNDANADAGEEDVEFPDGGAVAAEVAGGGEAAEVAGGLRRWPQPATWRVWI